MNHLALRVGIILTLILTSMGSHTAVRAESSDDFMPEQVVMKLHAASDLEEVAADHALDPTPLDQFGTRPIYLMRILDGASPLDRTVGLSADPRILYAEPNFIGRAPEGQQRVSWAKGDESSRYQEQWAVSMIRLPEAHTISRGAGVTVAVLDTGVDVTHPAFEGRLVNGYDFVDWDADPSEVGSPEENHVYGHGTHVAGLVALVAPEAKIMPIRVLDEEGVGNIWVLAEAMAYAMNPDGDITTADGADVINLSLGTDHPTNLLAEIENDVSCSDDDEGDDECLADQNHHGAVVAVAAGNDGLGDPEYPAAESVSSVLAVGASTSEDELASFSNHGSWVHVVAPGDALLSTVPGGGYAFWGGTSTAAPLVAGQAALIRAANPALAPALVVQKIKETSAVISGPVPLRIDTAASLGIPLVQLTGEYICTDALGPVRADNILVPKDQACTLVGTRISGNIKVEEGATLNAIGVDIKGSVQAKGFAFVSIIDSEIQGSVQVEEGGSSHLETSLVVGGALFVKNSGSLTILNNTILSNLQCKENNRMPTGAGNTVSGNKEEQCSSL